jgi:glycosyltransferase involved in cell wall biosynthesis
MKILYLRTVFWFGFRSGGSVAHTSGVINELSKHVKLDIISNDKLLDVEPLIKIVSPGLLKALPFRWGEFFYNFKLIPKLKKIIRKYTIIYHRYSGLSFAAAYLAKKYNLQLILEFNGSDVWMLKHWSNQSFLLTSIMAWIVNSFKIPVVLYVEEYNLKNASLIIVPSSPLKDTLIRKGIHGEKILVNPNGVDPEKYSPSVPGSEIREKYSLKNHEVIGFIGTFAQWHGVVEMAKAIELFYQSNGGNDSNVKFLLVGDGRLMPIVKKMIDIDGIRGNVILTGLVPQNEGPKYLAACDILLSPHIKNPDGSRFFGSPTKLFEYMAMSKPIIASNLDQIGEVLKHGKTAYLVEPGNIKQLADAMKRVLKNPQMRENLSRNARIEVLGKYTWRKHVENILIKLSAMK